MINLRTVKKATSFIACIIIVFVLFNNRINRSEIKSPHPLKITTWDAYGYYIYLPSFFIYHDATALEWVDDIEKKYSLSGGWFYQAAMQEHNNKYVFKYLGGVSILQIPFFTLGHFYAKNSAYEADGFSAPYQYALGFGVIIYVVLALFLLRHILLKYFDDFVVAITLLLLFLATNIIQYVSFDGAMSHAYIFPLYVLLLYTTIKWHEKPTFFWAALTGFIIGLATICRPTEAIMFLIPLLWGTENKTASKEKWKLVKENKSHIYIALGFGFIGILPQLVYWQYATGFFIHNVGSAWDFLTPHIRVLIGWEKGWFIYTPITVFFMAGLFYIKKFPFRKAVLWFCLINIYIIISWRDWRYGGSYSTRALVQSYPVFALALAGFISHIMSKKWRYAFYALGAYLIFVNFFQLKQYYTTVLHYYDMNRKYYSRIYLKKIPSALDMSMLDTKDWIRNEKKFQQKTMLALDSTIYVEAQQNETAELINLELRNDIHLKNSWLKIESKINSSGGFYMGFLNAQLEVEDSVKHERIRLFRPLTGPNKLNEYAFYMKVPDYFRAGNIRLYIDSNMPGKAVIEDLKISYLSR